MGALRHLGWLLVCVFAVTPAMAQQNATIDVEGVVHVCGWMIQRRVQRNEVVPVGLDLRPPRARESKPGQDRTDLIDHLGDRVPATPPCRAPVCAR